MYLLILGDRKMKRINIFVVLTLLLCSVVSSCTKKQELTKSIPSSNVSLSGKHRNLLAVDGDSVKIMLVCPEGKKDEWEVRALVQIKNTKSWREVYSSYRKQHKNYEPKMGNFCVNYIDANGSTLLENNNLKPDWDVIESVLSSDEKRTENMLIQSMFTMNRSSYDKQKTIFDKVAGITFSQMELNEIFTTSGGSSATMDDDIDASSSKKSTSKKEKLIRQLEAACQKGDAIKAALVAEELAELMGDEEASPADVARIARANEILLQKAGDADW